LRKLYVLLVSNLINSGTFEDMKDEEEEEDVGERVEVEVKRDHPDAP
jgi:hypothetical protein